MDESLVLCAMDLCGRPYLVYDLDLDRETVGDLETCLLYTYGWMDIQGTSGLLN